MTASELAQELNLDAATVVRFSQQLGYSGYPKLQKEIRQKVKSDLLMRPQLALDKGSIPGIVAETMQELVRALERIRISLDTDAVERLVEMIGQARRIVILPEAPAQPAAYNLVYFLEQGGFSVYIARPGVADLARTVHTATSQDLLLAVDVSGQSPTIATTLNRSPGEGYSDCGDCRSRLDPLRSRCRCRFGSPGSSIAGHRHRGDRGDRVCPDPIFALALCRALCRGRTSYCGAVYPDPAACRVRRSHAVCTIFDQEPAADDGWVFEDQSWPGRRLNFW